MKNDFKGCITIVGTVVFVAVVAMLGQLHNRDPVAREYVSSPQQPSSPTSTLNYAPPVNASSEPEVHTYDPETVRQAKRDWDAGKTLTDEENTELAKMIIEVRDKK